MSCSTAKMKTFKIYYDPRSEQSDTVECDEIMINHFGALVCLSNGYMVRSYAPGYWMTFHEVKNENT